MRNDTRAAGAGKQRQGGANRNVRTLSMAAGLAADSPLKGRSRMISNESNSPMAAARPPSSMA